MHNVIVTKTNFRWLKGQVTATAGRFSDSNVSSDSNPGPLETVFYSLKGRFGRWYSTDVSKG
jgi:hypothetical protein